MHDAFGCSAGGAQTSETLVKLVGTVQLIHMSRSLGLVRKAAEPVQDYSGTSIAHLKLLGITSAVGKTAKSYCICRHAEVLPTILI